MTGRTCQTNSTSRVTVMDGWHTHHIRQYLGALFMRFYRMSETLQRRELLFSLSNPTT
jgi:hypothetical protein